MSDRRAVRQLKQGEQFREQARAAFDASLEAADPTEAERLAREALSRQFSAFNWLEDTDGEEDVHRELHEMGRSTRERFPDGCVLIWNGSRYEHRCPVALCHKRFGFSPGMIVGRRICSICGEDISECPHLGDQLYKAPGGPSASGYCPVCVLQVGDPACDHSPNETYDVEPVSIITEIVRLEEISLVSRPNQPDARLTAIPIDSEALQAALGPRFRYGIDRVFCSECLTPCSGFDRMPGDPRLTSS
jgi:hypothetical protein